MTARPTFARVDLDALARNFRTLGGFVASGRDAAGRDVPGVIGVVKANAYGHGAVAVGRTLEAAGAPMLACADIAEGVALREGGVSIPILIFGALSVGDDGQGMDAETRQRALEPFFTTKGVGEGTGLGLSIVYGIVRGWNGSIDIQSEPGHGTRVTRLFPLEAA